MDPRRALQDLELKLAQDPDVAKLSYGEQRQARAILYDRILSEGDPDYQMLNQNEKIEAITTITAKKRPIFENPQSNVIVNDILSRAESGETLNLEKAWSSIMHGMIKESIVGNVLIKPLTGVAASVAGKDNPATDLLKMVSLTGNDADKAMSYFRENAIRNDPEAAKAFSTGSTMGTVLGFVVDFIGMHGSWEKATGGAIKAFTAKQSLKYAGLKSTIVRSAIPALYSGTSSGAYGVFREQFLGMVNREDERLQDSVGKVAKTFGSYAALDYALNFVGGLVLPYIKTLRHLKTGKTSNALKKFTPEDLDKLINQVTEGSAPAELLEQLDPISKHYLLGQADLRRAAGRLDDAVRLRPYDDLLLNANDAGMTVYWDEASAQFSVYRPMKKGAVVMQTTTDDIIEAKREVSRGLNARLAEIEDPVHAQDFADRHGAMLNYSKASDLVDGSFDPSKIEGQLEPEVAKIVRPKGTAAGYTSSVDRPYVGRTEVEGYQKAFGEGGSFAGTFKVDVGEETLNRVQSGKRIFKGGESVQIQGTQTGQAEAFVLLRKPIQPSDPVSIKAMQTANGLADKAIANGATQSRETLRNMYLMEAGYDGIVKNRNAVEVFYPDKVKFVADKFDPVTGKIGKLSVKPAPQSGISTRGTIEKEFVATFSGKDIASNKKAFVDAASKFKGTLDQDEVRRFSGLILDNYGVDASKVRIKQSGAANSIAADASKGASVTFSDKGALIEIPSEITTPKAQQKFIEDLFENLQTVAKKYGTGTMKGTSSQVGKLAAKSATKFTSPLGNPIATENWLRGVVQENLSGTFNKTAHGFEAILKDGTKFTSDNVDDLLHKVMVSQLDLGTLKFDMSRQGYSITKMGDDLVVRGPNLTEPITAKSIPELVEKMNYVPEKISHRFAPTQVSIKRNAIDIKYQDGIIVGNRRNVKHAMAKFENMDHMARLRKVVGNGIDDVYIRPAGDYEAHVGHLGEIRTFSTLKDARRYVESGWKSFDNIKDLAHKKGLDIWFDKGTIKMSDGATTFTAKTHDDVAKIMKDFPDTTANPDLIGALDPKSLSPIDEVLYKFDMSDLKNYEDNAIKIRHDMKPTADVSIRAQNLTARQELRALVENMDYWTEKTMKDLNQPEILRKYRNVETARRLAEIDIQKTREAVIGTFTKQDGKLLPLERRKAIFYHASYQTVEEQADAIKLFGELSAEEKGMMDNLRKLMGAKEGSALTGLAGKFGVTPDSFINNYMPRIMDWASKNASKINDSVTAQDLFDMALRDVYGTKATPKLNAFFKNLRASEILTFSAIDDPIEAIEHYSRVGHRQMYMGQAWEDLYSVLSRDAPERVITRFNRYREQLMGVYTTSGEQTLHAVGDQFGKAVGLRDGKELAQTMFSLNYLSNMAFRPWLALRNTTQIYTTLAPRFGNEWVTRAVNAVADMDEGYYAYLMKIGVIQDAPPIVNEIRDANSLLGKVTRRGLRMFKRSDDITRAIAYKTGEIRFDYGMQKLKRGVVDMDGFFKESGISRMDDDTIREVRRLMQVGTDDAVAAAKTKYGTKIVEDTMFGYRSSQAPTAFTGSLPGKLFGQYGTYSAGYRANIYRAFQNGSIGDKLAFTARFVGNQAALYGAFRVLGIKANNFIPGSPALFGGGPLFEVGVALAQSGSTSYQGEQARAFLARKFLPVTYSDQKGFRMNYPELAPGSLQLRYAQKSLDYLQKGDPWRAFLAATTTPVYDEED